MIFNEREVNKITDAIRAKLLEHKFTFGAMQVKYEKGGVGLMFVFTDVKHVYFKNVRLITINSYVHDTTLFTYVYVQVRFLHGELKSPIIGFSLINFKIVLS